MLGKYYLACLCFINGACGEEREFLHRLHSHRRDGDCKEQIIDNVITRTMANGV